MVRLNQPQDPADKFHDHTVWFNLDQWLEKLNDKQHEVVERRFRLHSHDCATLEGVARGLGVTRERVFKIQIILGKGCSLSVATLIHPTNRDTFRSLTLR